MVPVYILVYLACRLSYTDSAEIYRDGLKSPVGPPYPVTAAFFKDRYSRQEWNDTLTHFKKIGGDTVFLKAPRITKTTKAALEKDAVFKWCLGSDTGLVGNVSCWEQAETDLKAFGLNVAGFLTYKYNEGYSDVIMQCPKLDKKIAGKHTFYRIVLPTNSTAQKMKSNCDFPKGSDVLVLFSYFNGTDPHQRLVETAAKLNMKVYFSLPQAPSNNSSPSAPGHVDLSPFDKTLLPAYYAWVGRVLMDHKSRYSQLYTHLTAPHTANRLIYQGSAYRSEYKKILYNFIPGYYSPDQCSLPQMSTNASTLQIYASFYTKLGYLVRKVQKQFVVSPTINTNKHMGGSVSEHVEGFEHIAALSLADIIAVEEGRGAGLGSYYWPYQLHQPIKNSDPVLTKILLNKENGLYPNKTDNITFFEAFTASNQAVFQALQASHQSLQKNLEFDFWLNVEAFEATYDDLCQPAARETMGGRSMDRASKSRVDRSLSAGGSVVQRVLSTDWDPDYTCITKKHNTTLPEDINSDLNRPIVAHCSFHSYTNLSVVLLGFNLDGYAYTVNWTDIYNATRSISIYGYWFILDYGAEQNLVESLQFVMLYDIDDMNRELAPIGTIHIISYGKDAASECHFDYNLPNKIVG